MSVGVSVKPRAKMAKTQKNISKPTKKTLIIAQEIKLAKILAGNNKTLRDRTLRRLKKWFDAREAQMPFAEDDFMRIWKGLFFYMWMADKPLVQEECAENISKLVHFKNVETSVLFFRSFLQTMVNEWFGIDYLRLDKFLMLVRRVLRQTLSALITNWDNNSCELFQKALSDTVLKPVNHVPLSLSMHVTEIYLEEISKVSKGELSPEQILEFLKPFAVLLAKIQDYRLREHVKIHIFQYLMNQSDVGLDYQERFNAWRQAGFPGGTIDSMEKVEIEKETNGDCDDLEYMEEEGSTRQKEESPLDPRAGKVHVDLPQIKFDPLAVAEMLESYKYDPESNVKSRKSLAYVAELFRRLSKGAYPLGLKKIRTKPRNIGESTHLKSALKRLKKFDRQLMGDSKISKTKRRKSRKIRDIVAQELEKYKDLSEKKDSSNIEEFITQSEEGLFSPTLVENQTKKLKSEISKKKPKVDTPILKRPKKQFRRNSGVWEVDDLDTSEKPSTPKSDEPKTIKKTKKRKLEIIEEISEEVKNLSPSLKTEKTVSRNKSPRKTPKAQKFIVENQNVSSTPLKTPSMVKNPFSTPVSSSKKVKIALNLNRSQDHIEYHKSLVESPGIPYDAERKPHKPLLKQRPGFINNINPFYKKK